MNRSKPPWRRPPKANRPQPASKPAYDWRDDDLYAGMDAEPAGNGLRTAQEASARDNRPDGAK
jgi:hypothetical protein